MRFAIITNATNTVVREFEAADDYIAPEHKFGLDHDSRVVVVVETQPPSIASGQVLQRIEQITETELQKGWVVVSAPIPQEVAMWALKELCLVRGHAADIEAALNSLPDPPRTIARNRWENKDTISRNSPIIAQMQQLLGWSNAYVDELFVESAKL